MGECGPSPEMCNFMGEGQVSWIKAIFYLVITHLAWLWCLHGLSAGTHHRDAATSAALSRKLWHRIL